MRAATVRANDERLELRAPSSELREWRAAALADNAALSDWIRRAARSFAAPSPVRVLLNELRDFVLRHRAGGPDATRTWELHLTESDEMQLFHATPADVGAELAERILVEGPRGAITKLFGLQVQWDSQSRSIAPRAESAARGSA